MNLKDILEQPDTPDLDDAARERIVTSAAIRYRHAARVAEEVHGASQRLADTGIKTVAGCRRSDWCW